MNLDVQGVIAGGGSILGRFRQAIVRVPLSMWMLLLVFVAVAGYGVLGIRYYFVEHQQRELLKQNSIYIELDQHVHAAQASQRVAMLIAQNAGALPAATVQGAIAAFVKSARDAAAANRVPPLNDRFTVLRDAAAGAEQAVGAGASSRTLLLSHLEAAGEILNLLGLITQEGRQAEWENLTSGSQSNFETIIAMIVAGGLMVGSLGYLVTITIKDVFADVIRINSAIARGQFEIEIPPGHNYTEAGQMYGALKVFRDHSAERSRLEANAATAQAANLARQQRIDGRIDEFRSHVQQLLEAVGDNMKQMHATAQLLARSAEDTSKQASGAAKASEHASSNVETVAAAAEELAASIAEINNQVSETTNVVVRATDSARHTTERVARLMQSAQKIGEVVNLIRAIADQTNLLALNATIEAARAGDAGKGFAVVAAEVKSLANQTAKATEEIGGQISSIQASVGQSGEAIKILAATMEEVNSYTSVIASSVDRQGEATAEISTNVHQAASETQKVAANMAGVTAAVGDTMRSATMVEQSTNEVVKRAAELRHAVNQFLDEVATA